MAIERSIHPERLSLGNLNIGIIGAEGSGKTTVAQMLKNVTGKVTFSTGDIVRDLAQNDTSEIGDKCRQILTEHVYLDGATLLKIVQKRIDNPDTRNGFIVDGAFRTVEEIKGWPEVLKKAGRDSSVIVVHLHAPNDICVQRLLSGSRHREDDTPEGIARRHLEFYGNLNERLEAIQQQKGWKILNIDTTECTWEVFFTVKQVLRKHVPAK